MRVSFGTFSAVIIATGALAAGTVRASPTDAATHWFVRGEHFTYSSTLSFGGEGVVIVDGPATMTASEDIVVREVSPAVATLVYRVEHDAATGFSPSTRTIRATPDGIWRFDDGRVTENVATWDPAELGPHPPTVAVGQRWAFDVAKSEAYAPAHAEVSVVAADNDEVRLRVDGTVLKRSDADVKPGQLRTSDTWITDVTFRNGIVRERRRVDTTHIDHGPGTPGVDNRTVRTTRLIGYTAS